MNTRKTLYMTGLAVAIGCAVASVIAVNRQQAAQEQARQKAAAEQRAARQKAALAQIARERTPAVAMTAPAATSAPKPAAGAPPIESPTAGDQAATQKAAPVQQPGAAQGPAVQDPLAREALSFVGADPTATAYWATAINNPNLSDDERQNLIEDLNEDGLSDPKHPGPQDLPLILNRIQLIEELAPYAMDQVNADAFAEAYKDLVNMVNGVPVR